MKLQHFFILTIIALIALVGCSSEQEQQVDVQQPEQSQQITTVQPSEAVQETVQEEEPQLVEDGNTETTAGESVKEFEMLVHRFAFEPNVIRVNKGDRVIIHATSTDVAHSFLVPELNINERTPAGETVDIEFVADVVGEFDFRCGVPCGSGHRDMVGKIIVE
jgi:heme/copper-type cytochrome/quinol oxidase subunit 2